MILNILKKTFMEKMQKKKKKKKKKKDKNIYLL